MNYVEEILNRSRDIHLKKREDYATNPTADPFENFDRSSEIARWFPVTYSSFAVLIGTKLARLGSLLVTGKAPNNESIDDTFLDLVTYCALFYAYWKERTMREKAAIELGYVDVPDGIHPDFPEAVEKMADADDIPF